MKSKEFKVTINGNKIEINLNIKLVRSGECVGVKPPDNQRKTDAKMAS